MMFFCAKISSFSSQIIKRFASSQAYIRNIGIIAHIDAGKTTTTERMLYYAGYMPHVGEVHRGNTVMDYMDQERDRGITITSAAITFPWKDHQVNLIDTPGHVDFTIEVERAVRVLDGGVVILDGSAGVEAQTETVWRQAQKHELPCIAFINKMDKFNFDFQMSIDSVRRKLNSEPLMIQIPLPKDAIPNKNGLIDVVNMQCLLWDKQDMSEGKVFIAEDVHNFSSDIQTLAKSARAALVEKICDFDEIIAEEVISSENFESISSQGIYEALRRITLQQKNKAMVTLCGSAYKNYGVQALMDAVISFLPSPDDKSFPFLQYYGQQFCGLAFKTLHHPQKGNLTFTRLYSGSLHAGDNIYNSTKMSTEKIGKLMVAFADDYKNVSRVSEGNIAVLSGMKDTFTGDTLVQSSSLARSILKKYDTSPETAVSPALPGVDIPDSVFFCSIEPPSMKDQKQLDLALEYLSKEDPSLKVKTDPDTGQTVLSGMGELHLDVIRDRILKEYKVDADLGSLMIAYKEAVVEEAREETLFERQLGDQKHSVLIDIEVKPILKGAEEVSESILKFSHSKKSAETLNAVKPWQMKSLWKGFESAKAAGPLLHYPVVNSSFVIHNVVISNATSDAMISSGMVEAVKRVMKLSETRLLEPIMRLDITIDKTHASAVTQDLIRKRGGIVSAEERDGEIQIMEVHAPLAELRGYSSYVRKISSGRAIFGMELHHYQMMDEFQEAKAIEEVTGFPPRR